MSIDLADAACVDFPTEWWFADRGDEQRAALAICARCPVAQACLDAVLEVEGATAGAGRHGLFGGLTPDERARLPRAAVPVRAPCGTPAAYRAHERAGERPCVACREGNAAYRRGLAAKARAA